MRVLFTCIISLVISVVHADVDVKQPIQNALGVVERVTPGMKAYVTFEIDNTLTNKFTLEAHHRGIKITSANTAGLVAGYGYYLRHIANLHFSWNGDRLEMPVPIPLPQEKKTVERAWHTVFAYNYCTLSYSCAFWDWKRWERELDMLALNGFTHALVTTGLEKTWQIFLKSQGYPEKDVIRFIPNPAFAAWWNMGNLEGHGGPLTQNMIDQEASIGRNIVVRMQELGITPVLQAYIGFMPEDFENKAGKPDMKFVPQGTWCGFTRPSIMDPTCKAFPAIAEQWYKALHLVYGVTSSAYAGDLFHEGGKSTGINVTTAAKAVQVAMLKASPNSTWIIQCWGGNPTNALLEGTTQENTLILQLSKNLTPSGGHMRSFLGRKWLWGQVDNFGGREGLYAGFQLLSHLTNYMSRYKSTGMDGIAFIPEAIETNPLTNELFFQRIWRTDDIDTSLWLTEYAKQRYGIDPVPQELLAALTTLTNSVYAPVRQQEGAIESLFCARPGWNAQKASTWSTSQTYYKLSDVTNAAQHYIQVAEKHPDLMNLYTFRYDLVAIVRQVLADAAVTQRDLIKKAFEAKDIVAYDKEVAFFLTMGESADTLLSAIPQFMLGTWTQRAWRKGQTQQEKENMLRAAKMLITTWTSNSPDPLNDYSCRLWSGMITDFYLPRWERFFMEQRSVLTGKNTQEQVNETLAQWMNEFNTSFYSTDKQYPTEPTGDALALSKKIMADMSTHLEEYTKDDKSTNTLNWTLEADTEMTFNVTEFITQSGTYKATFQQENASNDLHITSVDLYEGDKLVASDNHAKQIGTKTNKHVYILKLKQYRTNLDTYTLKVKATGTNGKNTKGTLLFNRER